jgi:hypothetical protein
VAIQELRVLMMEWFVKVELKKMEKQNLVEDVHGNIVELDQDCLLLQKQTVVEQTVN